MSTQMIELLILFAIAAFVLFRLKSVIGTRTGFEAPPDYLNRDRAAKAADADRAEDEAPDDVGLGHPIPESAKAALAAMRKAEPDFSLGVFLVGARGAYEMILMAYESGDRETLSGLLDVDVYKAFESVIAERAAAGLNVDSRFIGVRDLRLENATFDAATSEADLTLRFVGELITSVHDSEGRVVEGDPNEVRRQTDVWTFSRRMGARDPNWRLSATGE
ncbi:MAG TPA: Tim44/TimA family putative adaptor protein [Thermohalobaculum sp.]|nr:Tim44/TimA family putative adaptor protein [Thermohalobaculum sp.]